MTLIKNTLELDLQEDIKNVIDLQDQSENAIQSEIESYIVTDGIGQHLSKFINLYTSNIKETGVWLSGFYGSGKSYFGKMLGYLIDNPKINGTDAIDRFLPRLNGVENQSLIESDIRKLNSINSKVIFLDVAKQNTDNGLSFTLFANFLKRLGFREDLYGYMEYELFIDGKYDLLKSKSKELFGKEWNEIKNSNREIAKATRRFYASIDYTDAEYEDTKNTYAKSIETFSSTKFKDELEKYLVKFPDETLVFVFDEASEAISQKKFTLLDLEGLSESLSSISKKVWTIAIAQEKLDDVISNSNVSRANLNKVTDRFKSKVHLESTEVDVIIRNRLLKKKAGAHKDLVAYFKENDGLVSNATNLKSNFPTQTESAEQFATYYPFHKYQFELLQKFLFSSNALVANQIAARGMIITTFDILRRDLKDQELYNFSTAQDLCTEAQTSPPVDLVNKYTNSKKIIENRGIAIDGEQLLKCLHFINVSELVFPTVESITKAYISDITTYYEIKPLIEEALNILVESKILLVSNNNYKITSNLEGKLLEEMKDFDVALFIKKRELVTYLKNLNLFRQVNVINEDSVAYNFNIMTDLGDEIISSNNKNLKLTVYSLFNINEERQDFIETLKLDTQYTKDNITLVPDNTRFDKIDKLIDEVRRYSLMEEKYGSDSDVNTRQIIREFSTIKEEKEKDLINLIEAAYTNGSLIYLFDENLLNKDSFKGSVNETQRKLIKNIYTKRLTNQLSEAIGSKLITESNDEKLHRYFSGDEFKFFDSKGNFTGDHLKVVEELTAKMDNRYIDGKSLEDELSIAPWGYSYGTLSSTLAALFRAGRLVVKFNDTEYFSFREKASHEVFNSSTKFKSARFKSITKTLTADQKNKLVQALLDLKFESHTGNKISWTSSDFDLANAVTQLAEHFISSINTLSSTLPDFDKLFSKVKQQKDVLQNYSSKTTEGNYIEKAENFLDNKEEYSKAIENIVAAEKFIKKNLDKIKGYSRFVVQVNTELNKADLSENEIINSQTTQFNEAYKNDVVEKFTEVQNAAQAIKDEYYNLMSSHCKMMTSTYQELKENTSKALKDLNDNYPKELNKESERKLNDLIQYCASRIVKEVKLEYHIECQNCGFSLSDILNYIALASSKETELQLLKSSFIKEAPTPPVPGKPKPPKKLQLNITKRVMTASEYKALLAGQLQAMAGMDNDDEIELTINN
ncbi:BREX system P-loop protein BrxC [Winogradskyella sediminis]|uniref:BREX system P-loop protein BrxC n=1 Tax=Winogradskyella sediminis TaxID=1382466 RepID=UPI003AA9A8A9